MFVGQNNEKPCKLNTEAVKSCQRQLEEEGPHSLNLFYWLDALLFQAVISWDSDFCFLQCTKESSEELVLKVLLGDLDIERGGEKKDRGVVLLCTSTSFHGSASDGKWPIFR